MWGRRGTVRGRGRVGGGGGGGDGGVPLTRGASGLKLDFGGGQTLGHNGIGRRWRRGVGGGAQGGPRVVRVGGLLDRDEEMMVGLKPDWVLVPNLANQELRERLESLGLTVVVLNPEGLDNLPKDFRLVGQAT